MKFFKEMKKSKESLRSFGHEVLMPEEMKDVDYWSEDRSDRVTAKRRGEFIRMHMNKIVRSDAILVVNITRKDIENYIGANTFLEIGFAHYNRKIIFLLNPIPEQSYIIDEIETIGPEVIDGDYSKII